MSVRGGLLLAVISTTLSTSALSAPSGLPAQDWQFKPYDPVAERLERYDFAGHRPCGILSAHGPTRIEHDAQGRITKVSAPIVVGEERGFDVEVRTYKGKEIESLIVRGPSEDDEEESLAGAERPCRPTEICDAFGDHVRLDVRFTKSGMVVKDCGRFTDCTQIEVHRTPEEEVWTFSVSKGKKWTRKFGLDDGRRVTSSARVRGDLLMPPQGGYFTVKTRYLYDRARRLVETEALFGDTRLEREVLRYRSDGLLAGQRVEMQDLEEDRLIRWGFDDRKRPIKQRVEVAPEAQGPRPKVLSETLLFYPRPKEASGQCRDLDDALLKRRRRR